MSEPAQQVRFKSFRPHEWPAMSKHVRKDHERIRTRGFTPDEIRLFKNRGRWEKGEYVEAGPSTP